MSEKVTDRPVTGIEGWIEKIREGDPRAVARAISAVENREAPARALLQRLFPHTGRATIVGVTGAPGSGKSTLVDALATLLRKKGHTVGILAVDPTSPFTGGAILGDRVRMQGHAGDPGIYIRSMATRGTLGGLSAATFNAALVLDASGKEFILVETVGVGQDEVDVVKLADLTLVLLVPGMGDDVQAFKAGIMEIADVFVLNKADAAGADRLEQEIRAALSLSQPAGPQPPIVKTVATRGEGVEELLAALSACLAGVRDRGNFEQRRARQWRERIVEMLRERLLERVREEALQDGVLKQYAASVAARRQDPYTVVDEILKQAGWSDPKRQP